MKVAVVVAWVTEKERQAFLDAWRIKAIPDWLVLQCVVLKEGCGATKNGGILRAAERGAGLQLQRRVQGCDRRLRRSGQAHAEVRDGSDACWYGLRLMGSPYHTSSLKGSGLPSACMARAGGL